MICLPYYTCLLDRDMAPVAGRHALVTIDTAPVRLGSIYINSCNTSVLPRDFAGFLFRILKVSALKEVAK